VKVPRLSPLNKKTLVFTIAYMALFTGIAVNIANYEFLYYLVLMAVLVVFIMVYHENLHLGHGVLGALSALGFLHVLGGNIFIDGVRLYDYRFLSGLLRYDNVMHGLGLFIVTIALYSATAPHVGETIHHRHRLVSLLVVLMALGVGSLIEVVEFGAVAFLDAGGRVGDYWNNALDLLFNLGGASAAVLLLSYSPLRRLVRGTQSVPLGAPTHSPRSRSRR